MGRRSCDANRRDGRRFRLFAAAVAVLVAGTATGPAAAPTEFAAASPAAVVAQYIPVELGTPFGTAGGPWFSRAYDINDVGHVVGYASFPEQGPSQAMYQDPGSPMAAIGDLGGGWSIAFGVNELGQAVGQAKTEDGFFHAFYWPGSGGLVDLGTLGGADSSASAVNDDGVVVGNSTVDGSFFPEAFRIDAKGGGSLEPLASLGGQGSNAMDINEDGVIVGSSVIWDTLPPLSHATLWGADGEPVDLGTLGGEQAGANAINDSGQVVGSSWLPGAGVEAFLWDDTDGMVGLGFLGVPGGGVSPYSEAFDINDGGQVVGTSGSEDAGFHGFVWTEADGMVELPPLPGYPNSYAQAINDDGLIVGWAYGEGPGDSHAVMWVPPPTFPDVPSDHPFVADIEWLADSGVTGGFGDGTFRPASGVTRGSMAAFLYRFAGEPAFTPPGSPTFGDVGVSHPFFAEIEWLAAEGITGGFTDGGFHPGEGVTRGSMAAFLHRFAGEPAFTPPATPTFGDVGVSHPFFAEVEWLADTGVTGGFPDGTYRPGVVVSRGSMAAFLHRFDEWEG